MENLYLIADLYFSICWLYLSALFLSLFLYPIIQTVREKPIQGECFGTMIGCIGLTIIGPFMILVGLVYVIIKIIERNKRIKNRIKTLKKIILKESASLEDLEEYLKLTGTR